MRQVSTGNWATSPTRAAQEASHTLRSSDQRGDRAADRKPEQRTHVLASNCSPHRGGVRWAVRRLHDWPPSGRGDRVRSNAVVLTGQPGASLNHRASASARASTVGDCCCGRPARLPPCSGSASSDTFPTPTIGNTTTTPGNFLSATATFCCSWLAAARAAKRSDREAVSLVMADADETCPELSR
jgi:hypothetical protein